MYKKDVIKNSKVNWSYILLGVLAFLFVLPLDFPLRHTHEYVVYHEDDHDVCRAAGWLFGLIIFWYFMLMVSVVSTRHALEQTWAQRLLIYPNILMGLLGLIAVSFLYASLTNHSDEGFARVMGTLNGMVLGVNIFYCWTIINNPLSEGYRYGWSILFYSTGTFLLLLTGLSIYEYQWYVTMFSIVITVPFILGFSEISTFANKIPYKF